MFSIGIAVYLFEFPTPSLLVKNETEKKNKTKKIQFDILWAIFGLWYY